MFDQTKQAVQTDAAAAEAAGKVWFKSNRIWLGIVLVLLAVAAAGWLVH